MSRTNEIKGTYGSSIVLLSSDRTELEVLKRSLSQMYDVVMDIEILNNMDYSLVMCRKKERTES